MARWPPTNSARRHPSLTFGISGALFTLLFVVTGSVRQLAEGGEFSPPSSVEAVLVVGGFVGGALVSRVLWRRLGGAESPLRGALVGALIGLLALPVPMYLLEFTTVALEGIPFDPQPGMHPWRYALDYLFLLLAVPLVLGGLGVIVTRGGTVIVGALTGYLLARRDGA